MYLSNWNLILFTLIILFKRYSQPVDNNMIHKKIG